MNSITPTPLNWIQPQSIPGMRFLQYAAMLCLLWNSVTTYAFPPAPHHRFYGSVRNEYGHPITSEDAEIIFETSSGRVIKTSISDYLPAGTNYRLEVPMDAGLIDRKHKPTAMRPQMPFTIRVNIGARTFLPIEMLIDDNSKMGLAGQKTLLNLTLGEDADGDGLPDAWERELMQRMKDLDDVDPNGDADGDGLTNLEEYISGNYAYDDENEFTLDVVGFNESSAVLEFMAIRGRDYTVYVSSNLTDWTPTTFRMPDSAEPNVSYQHYRAQDVRAVRVEVPSLGDEGKLQYFKLLVQ